MLKKLFVFFLLLAVSVSAVIIIPEPHELFFDDLLVDGYAEDVLVIRSDSDYPSHVSLSATQPFDEWFSFSPESVLVSRDSPAEFTVIVRPFNASVGVYQGYVILNVVNEGDKLSTAVSTSSSIVSYVGVTDEVFSESSVVDLSVNDVDFGTPVVVKIFLENVGNVPVDSFFVVNVSGDDSFFGSFSSDIVVVPSHSVRLLSLDILGLSLGDYEAFVSVFSDDNLVRSHDLSFSVLQPGSVLVESPVVVVDSPVALSSGWLMIFAWGIVLLYIVFKIAKKKRKK